MKDPKGGVCCNCGYKATEETDCLQRADQIHCEHWWDGHDNEEASKTNTDG